MTNTRLLPFPLVAGLRIATTGEGGSPAPWSYLDLHAPRGLVEAILRAESLELVSLQKNGSMNGNTSEFEWNIELISGWDRDNENPSATALAGGDLSANDVTTRGTAITSSGAFLPHSRLRLRFRNKGTNVAGVKTAVVWATLLVKVASA